MAKATHVNSPDEGGDGAGDPGGATGLVLDPGGGHLLAVRAAHVDGQVAVQVDPHDHRRRLRHDHRPLRRRRLF